MPRTTKCPICQIRTKRHGPCDKCRINHCFIKPKIKQSIDNEPHEFHTISLVVCESLRLVDPVEFSVSPPELYALSEFVGLFDGGCIHCNIEAQNSEFIDQEDFIVSSGMIRKLNLPNKYDSVRIKLQPISSPIEISIISMSCISMRAARVMLTEDIIIERPTEQNMTIGFVLGEKIQEAAGWETVTKKQVQIKTSSGYLYNVIGNSGNFQWRENNVLMCNLAGEQPYFVRLRYFTDQWIEWSNWLPFVPKRKMSL